MPLPKPHKGEDQTAFMHRCMGDDGMKTEFPKQDQRVAVCLAQWRRKKEDDEAIEKTIAADPPGDDPLEYVMSDGTVDRMGDVVEPSGWQLDNFKKNPIAFFGHKHDLFIGKWKNIRVQGGKLLGHLELLPPVSDRLREVQAAVQHGVLRAVSVGFKPIAGEYERFEKTGGTRYKKAELVECSLVGVPANPNALAVAKSLGLSSDVQNLIFSKPADRGQVITRANISKSAESNYRFQVSTPMTLSEKIEHAQTTLVNLQDQLREHMTKQDGDDIGEEFETITEELTNRIGGVQKQLETFQRAEAALAVKSDPVRHVEGEVIPPNRPFAMPKKDEKPRDILVKAITAAVIAHHQGRRPVQDVIRERYGDNVPVRAIADHLILRAASAPATTTTSGWAAELAQTAYGDFFDILYPGFIYPALSNYGMRLNLGRAGTINLPTRASSPSISGSFIAEGSPIPVRQGALTSVSFGVKKMGVITTFTREIMEHSNPTIESVVREMIMNDTQTTMDSFLIDATAASATRPAGLRNGVAATTATAGGGFDALVGDIKGLVGVLSGANALRAPVWIMNPVDQLSISLTENAGGDFPFRAEINQNRLMGFPVIVSTTVTRGMVILVDAADFVSITGDDPRFDLSDQAVLHMEDTTPLAIGTAGAPNTVAAPVRSMFQTDCIALRMILPCNWGMRRTGVVAWTTSITW